MTSRLSLQEVRNRIEEAQATFPRDECPTCECYLGYLVQLGFDADEVASSLIADNMPDRSDMHGCLGCEPCPPGDLFAAYLGAPSC